MNKVLFRKLEKLKEEVLYLKTTRAKLLKSGLSDIKRFINYIEKL